MSPIGRLIFVCSAFLLTIGAVQHDVTTLVCAWFLLWAAAITRERRGRV